MADLDFEAPIYILALDTVAVLTINYDGSARVVHSRVCCAVAKADDEKIRPTNRFVRPNLPWCQHCTDPVDKTQVAQRNTANKIREWADD